MLCWLANLLHSTATRIEAGVWADTAERVRRPGRRPAHPLHRFIHLAHFLQRSNQFSSLANEFPAIVGGAPRRAAGLLARVVLCDRRSEQVKS